MAPTIKTAAAARTASTEDLRARLTSCERALGFHFDRKDAAEARRIRKELDARGWK